MIGLFMHMLEKIKYPWTFDSYSGILYRQHGNNLIGGNIGLFAFLKRLKTSEKMEKSSFIILRSS